MYHVYALQSISRNYIYVGMTDNLERRIAEHQSGRSKTTAPYRPFTLIFTEEQPDRKSARLREKYFKSGIGKEKLKRLSE
jgi:putative endonuclease